MKINSVSEVAPTVHREGLWAFSGVRRLTSCWSPATSRCSDSSGVKLSPFSSTSLHTWPFEGGQTFCSSFTFCPVPSNPVEVPRSCQRFRPQSLVVLAKVLKPSGVISRDPFVLEFILVHCYMNTFEICWSRKQQELLASRRWRVYDFSNQKKLFKSNFAKAGVQNRAPQWSNCFPTLF